MGISIGGILKNALQVAVWGYKLFTKKDDAGEPVKPDFNDIWPDATANVMKAVQGAIRYGGITTKEKFDEWLATADATTGIEDTAIDLIRSLPADKEEELFDSLINAARIYGYSLLKVDGYTV